MVRKKEYTRRGLFVEGCKAVGFLPASLEASKLVAGAAGTKNVTSLSIFLDVEHQLVTAATEQCTRMLLKPE